MKLPYTIALSAGLAIILFVALGYYVWLAPVGSGEPRQFTVQAGDSISVIATHLQQDGLIKSAWGFKFYLKITGQVIVQPGTYSLSPAHATPRIASTIASGDTSGVTVTIPEGYTLSQLATLLDERAVAERSELLAVADDFPPDYDFLKFRPAGRSLEGFLFPDTYKFFKGDATLAIRKLLDNFSLKYKNEIEPVLGDQDLFEVLIIASLIEREAKTQTDREQIAAVFYNRLEAGMRLDVDATVRYITDNWTEPITRADLAIDSPYNTRRYAGLPPGPICNPGLAAITAALNPPPSDYYYYLTDLNGVTHYAETLAEHNQNKVNYLL